MQELEMQILSGVRIFVGNDDTAFFDVNKPTYKPTNVDHIQILPACVQFLQPYNFSVKNIGYFNIGTYKGPLRTVSVTGYCVVFCGYTTSPDGRIRSSGVYHAWGMPPERDIEDRLYSLIDTVRTNPDEQVTVKAVGRNSEGPYLKKLRERIIESLTVKKVKIQPHHILLGGKECRMTEFYPLSGQMVTCFLDINEAPIKGTQSII